MKALEMNAGFGRFMENPEKLIRNMKNRVKKTKSSIDTSTPRSYLNNQKQKQAPNRKKTAEAERQASINKDNLDLAHRIFRIMDHPSEIAKVVQDTRHLDIHPGTMNFPARLQEAQRIHDMNLRFAHRLDKVEPVYKRELYGVKPRKGSKLAGKGNSAYSKGTTGASKSAATSAKKKKKPHTAGVGHYIGNGALLTQASHASASPSFKRSLRKAAGGTNGSQSARKAELGDDLQMGSMTSAVSGRKNLLEYTKIQNGRVIDVVIVKNANPDSYSINGADIDTGRKYLLNLSSAEVMSILDGDILMTGADNIDESVEIWMTLLNKVTLKPIDGEDTEETGNLNAQDLDSYFTPHAPDAAKPSNRPPPRLGANQTNGSDSAPVNSTQNNNNQNETNVVNAKVGASAVGDNITGGGAGPETTASNVGNTTTTTAAAAAAASSGTGNDVGEGLSMMERWTMDRSKQLGVLEQTPGALDADKDLDDAARLIQTKMKGVQLQRRISIREEENKKKEAVKESVEGWAKTDEQKAELDKAAVMIQTKMINKQVERRISMREDKKKEEAAIMIQTKIKDKQVQNRISMRVDENNKKNEAAAVIQGVMRRKSLSNNINNADNTNTDATTPVADIGEESPSKADSEIRAPATTIAAAAAAEPVTIMNSTDNNSGTTGSGYTSAPSTHPTQSVEPKQPIPPSGANSGNTYTRRASAAFVGNILSPTQ